MAGTRKIRFVSTAVILCILLGIGLFLFWKPKAQREDYRAIASEEYNTVFLSMYPVDTYHAEDFAYYRGLNAWKASYCIPDLSTLQEYLQRIAASGNTVYLAYLGIRPDQIDPVGLQDLISLYPTVSFEIILSYPSLHYWQKLSPHGYEKALAAYQTFLAAVPSFTGAHFYFYASQEWLVANPANYKEEWRTTEDISRTIMLHSDPDHGYLVTAENAAALSASLEALTASARTQPKSYPDLSDHCIVFWGDSVIGNYTDSTSIPGVVAGLTGAQVFNCGYGGSPAAPLPSQVKALFDGDLSALPEDTQVYTGTAAYLQDPPVGKKMCYVVNYGLNDYFIGCPISSADPDDPSTFTGALRTAVASIRAQDPQAQIVLCTPNRIGMFDRGTEPHGDAGNVLADYAQAVLGLAEELQVDVLDNYNGLDFDPQQITTYLNTDLVHPNFAGRFAIADSLTALLR